MPKKKTIILGVTGSIAIYKACEIIRRLQESHYDISVVMTKEAEEFIRPLLFQALTGNTVYLGLFDSPDAWEIEHVSLAQKAELVLIAPATANVIGKIASGVCDDLLTCLVCATKAPVLICPAMNDNMYTNKVTQENMQKLKRLGLLFVEPQRGKLACGRSGIGRLAEVEKIVKAVDRIMA